MKKRAIIYYKGSVQGVGFRFAAEKIALGLGIKGYVKNLRDGGVEAACEGEEALIYEFLRLLDSRMGRCINTKEIIWQKYENEFNDFTIRFI